MILMILMIFLIRLGVLYVWTSVQLKRLVGLLSKQVTKDNNLAGLLYEKFEAHRKLMRYEQRAFNQLRKMGQIKK